MSEQDDIQSSTKQRRSRKTSIANQHNGKQAHAVQRPTDDNKEAWLSYWKEQGQEWRTEPEIDQERQKYLAERRAIAPDIERGFYPFKDIKLSRADVEWLLATHGNGQGPVYWSDERQREREGLDLRGADLCHLDLHHLPLARLRGGLRLREWEKATEDQRATAAVLLKGSRLRLIHLEGAFLRKAHLEQADLFRAYLEHVHLDEAYLEQASLIEAYLDKTHLLKINLCDEKGVAPRVVDTRWSDSNLAVVKWSQVKMLGDEHLAMQRKDDGSLKDETTRLEEFEAAVRANRQLAIALQSQGLNENAACFTYRAQKLQRVVLRRQRRFGQYFFSGFLDLLAGYGYRPGRSLIAYALVITVYATIYHLLGTHLAWNEAIVISMTAFHGLGFFPEQFKPGDPQAMVAAIEAFVGLLIEVTFIATLTQRFFGK